MARVLFMVSLTCLIATALGTSLDSWSTRLDDIPVEDDGLVLNRVCNGPNGVCALPLSGPNISIWHGNGECTYMYVGCSLTGMRLEFFSPASASKNWITWMGGADPSPANPPRDPKCSTHNKMVTGSGFGTTNSVSTSFELNECGTVFGETANGDVTQEQNVKIVEFLEVYGRTGPTQLSLVSHTNVKVKCCMSTDIEPATCVDLQSSATPLTDCTAVHFELDCEANEDEEKFYCTMKLQQDETLGNPDVAFYLNRCAVSSEGKGVFIIEDKNNGPEGNANLNVERQFNGASDADDAEYRFRFPYVQFTEPMGHAAHNMKVECAVNVVPKNEVPASAYLGLAPNWSR